MIKKKNQIKNETTPHRHLDFPFGRVERVSMSASWVEKAMRNM